jgi:hypothetical protein
MRVDVAWAQRDRQRATLGHGVAGVEGEVEDGVLELVRIGQGV